MYAVGTSRSIWNSNIKNKEDAEATAEDLSVTYPNTVLNVYLQPDQPLNGVPRRISSYSNGFKLD